MNKNRMSNPVWYGILSGLIFAIYMFPINGAKGDSMLPTMTGSDVCVNIRINPLLRINRGDIIMADKEINGKRHVMQKRVIGLPGDDIAIHDNKIYINEELLKEDYIQGDTSVKNLSDIDIRLANDQYYILGDNRADSYDSRYFGPICRDDIKYKLIFTYKPLFDLKLY
ncbi:signal peptidase I [[Clostridium] innocuum]|nr:signal peptidase I [[Clostridium] innocuum]SSA47147.1 signal peptidase I [[Clostridium] innocuum]